MEPNFCSFLHIPTRSLALLDGSVKTSNSQGEASPFSAVISITLLRYNRIITKGLSLGICNSGLERTSWSSSTRKREKWSPNLDDFKRVHGVIAVPSDSTTL